VFQLRIAVEDIDPPIWRRLLVPGAIRPSKLQLMIRAAFCWWDNHLHDFLVEGARYGTQSDDYPEAELDEKMVTVIEVVQGLRHFGYEYDFGDSWGHELVVENFWRMPVGLNFGVCVDGQNACPPEDVGGPPGYTRFLEAVRDPDHKEQERYHTWVGGSFDPSELDLALANARLQKVR
jgi:hypothetical protein